MRKNLLLGLLLCAASASAVRSQSPDTLTYAQWGKQFQDSRWKLYLTSGEPGKLNTRFFYDTASVDQVDAGILRVWSAALSSRLIAASGNHQKTHTLTRFEVRCTQGESAIVSSFDYNGSTVVAELNWTTNVREWHKPPFGTAGARLIDAVCKGRSGVQRVG